MIESTMPAVAMPVAPCGSARRACTPSTRPMIASAMASSPGTISEL